VFARPLPKGSFRRLPFVRDRLHADVKALPCNSFDARAVRVRLSRFSSNHKFNLVVPSSDLGPMSCAAADCGQRAKWRSCCPKEKVPGSGAGTFEVPFWSMLFERVRSESLQGGDYHNRNAGGDQAIFDGPRAENEPLHNCLHLTRHMFSHVAQALHFKAPPISR